MLPAMTRIDDSNELQQLWTALPEARVIGGAVRDLLANTPIADIDLATPLTPEATIQRLNATGIRTIPTGLSHGTITALIGTSSFEITTLRRDLETDGRHATVAFTDDWATDAARRDFTINAMSLDRDGTIHDYFTGRADLAAGIVRFVGDPATRIAEDYLRILRFFRFYARYASGEPDPAAIDAIRTLRAGLSTLSAERIWQELRRILAAPAPHNALHLMQETGVLAIVLPEATTLAGLDAALARNAPAGPLLRIAALINSNAPPLADRLKLSDAERTYLATLHKAPDLPPDPDEATIRRTLADHDAQTLIDKSWITPEPADRTTLRTRLTNTPRPVFPLQGRDAIALGATPGPSIGIALAATRAWWLDQNCRPNLTECRAELARRLISHKPRR